MRTVSTTGITPTPTGVGILITRPPAPGFAGTH